jgi:hypothetical protein
VAPAAHAVGQRSFELLDLVALTIALRPEYFITKVRRAASFRDSATMYRSPQIRARPVRALPV